MYESEDELVLLPLGESTWKIIVVLLQYLLYYPVLNNNNKSRYRTTYVNHSFIQSNENFIAVCLFECLGKLVLI